MRRRNDPPLVTDKRLLEAEDALMDGNFKIALSIAYDLLSSRTIRAPIAHEVDVATDASLPNESISPLKLSLQLNGDFSRCGAVLLQSWYELCQQQQRSSTIQHHFLDVFQRTTLPLDLWIVWMTLQQAHTNKHNAGISRTALLVLQKLVLLNNNETTTTTDNLDEACRECCLELIHLLFLEWLPKLSARSVYQLGNSVLPQDQNNNRWFHDSAIATHEACTSLCLHCSQSCHGWARETLITCHTKLQTDLLELRVEDESRVSFLATPVSAWNQQIPSATAWQDFIMKSLQRFQNQWETSLANKDTRQWRLVKGIIAATLLVLGYRRCRALLRSKLKVVNPMLEILNVSGLGRSLQDRKAGRQ